MANAIHYIDKLLAVSEGVYTDGAAYTPPGVDKKGRAYVPGNIYSTMALSTAARSGTDNKVYFKRGQYHVADNAFITTARQTFSDYGSTLLPLPVIDCNSYFAPGAGEDSLWTSNGNGTWTQTFAGASGYQSCRLWTGALATSESVRTQGTGRRRAASLGGVDATSPWFVNTGAPYAVTIWTGSNTVAPPTYYGGIIINQLGATRCTSRAFVFRNGANDGRVSYLKIMGSSGFAAGISSLTTAAVSGLQITNCELNSCNDGMHFFADAAGLYDASNVLLQNITIDQNSTATEIDLSPSDWMNADWINLNGNCYNFLVDNVTITTGNCHAALNTNNLSAGTLRCHDMTFSNVFIKFIQGVTDGRGVGMNNNYNITFKNVWVFSAAAFSQISGQRMKFISGGFVDMQYNVTNASECAQLVNVMSRGEAAVSTVSSEILFDHVVFDSRNSSAAYFVGSLGFETYTTGTNNPIPLNAVTVTNCLALLGPSHGFIVKTPLGGTPAVINNQNITKNWACPVSGTAGNKSGKVNDPPATFVDEGLNVTLGATGNTSALQSTLLLNADYSPALGSPLIAQGVHNIYKQDANAGQFWNPPAVGAFEYARPKTVRS